MENNLFYELLQEAFSKKIIPYPSSKEEAYNQGVLACKSILHDIQKRGFRSEDIARMVRCKDCIYWEKDRECWCAGSKQYYCYQLDICTDENFYCADGREKDDAER